MKAFVATSLRHTEEALRITELLKKLSIDFTCCVTELGNLEGKELFDHYYKEISNSDIFISIIKELGIDVATEIGIAYVLNKRRIGVVYSPITQKSDLMAYFASGDLIKEEHLEKLLIEITQKTESNLKLYNMENKFDLSHIISSINDVFKSGFFVEGKNVRRLENILSKKYNRMIVATSNATSGITILLDSLLDNRKEVIVPSLTFSATIQAIIHAGGIPIFADIKEDNWTLDPNDVEKKIGEKTGAIIPVNLFGVPCDIESFKYISTKYQVPVIYDSSQAFGTKTDCGDVGTFGDAEVFSLDVTKIVSGGMGGFITTNKRELYEKLNIAKHYGNDYQKKTIQRGINAKMTEIDALLAIDNLEHACENLKCARNNLLMYHKTLSKIHNLKLQGYGSAIISPQIIGVFVNYSDENISYQIQKHLTEQRIESRIFNPTKLHKLYFFSNNEDINLPITEIMHSKILCFPTHKKVRKSHIDTIANIMEEHLK
jgi:perosamine synthetase